MQWEDPEVDVQHLKITRDDTLFVITSAGDSERDECRLPPALTRGPDALHYAIAAKPRRIHCVDMNPCQGHLLELKLAAISALTHTEMWQMFGEGRIANFEQLLDNKLSPYLSSPCVRTRPPHRGR
jgi:betaine lipid synthase